jgi:ABC-type Fe3+-hydroxamate transport system substrate-binding protein
VLVLLLVTAAALSAKSAIHQFTNPPIHQLRPSRIISLVPAATEMLYAIGGGPQIVAVGSYDNYPPEVKALPRIGALLDPDVEKMLSLRPDLVVVYATQTDLKTQLARAHIAAFDYRNTTLSDVSATLVALGDATGHGREAHAISARIAAELEDIRKKVAGRPRPRTLLVFGREPLALRGIYASGGYGFLDDMLRIAGGDNVFADIKQESVQASTEQILARRPDVILEIRADESALSYGDRNPEIGAWNALPSVPAVRNRRVFFLVDDRLVIPGPRIAEGTRLIAQALHPEAFK